VDRLDAYNVHALFGLPYFTFACNGSPFRLSTIVPYIRTRPAARPGRPGTFVDRHLTKRFPSDKGTQYLLWLALPSRWPASPILF